MQTPIDVKDFLLVIAQVSVALGGFASVVKAVKRVGQDIEPPDFVGLRLTVEHSFAALFAALLPLALWYSGLQQPRVWRIASVPVAVFLALQLVSQIGRIKRASPRHPWGLRLHFLPGTILFLLMMIANVWRWQSEIAYIWSLVWLLNPPCFQLYLFFFPPEAKTT
jgi:hypothetical protein